MSEPEKITNSDRIGIELTKSWFGHTFLHHGEDATYFLIRRAAASGMPQGQFLDNKRAAQFIWDNLYRLTKEVMELPVPEDLQVRVVLPDGTFQSPTHIRFIRGRKGVKTAYPLILSPIE